MTSLLTNSAAMVALATLSDINNSLSMTNNRVSTGLRIAQASDSAAYWAIATTTRSDNGALSTVKDALSIGQATMDVTYNGLEAARDGLQEIKQLLVAARQPGVDRGNIQTQIDGIITDIENKAGASVINEQNFLDVTTGGTFNATKSVVASFERAAGGAVSVSTIDLDITNVYLIDATADAGILDQERGTGGTTEADFVGSILQLRSNNANPAAPTGAQLDRAPVGALTDSANDLGRIDEMIDAVDAALTETISAANSVGVVQARIESQMSFVDALMDANKRAVGALVDANMEEESTKLRALQTQQQLAVQSLAIANSSAQNVLALFG